MLKKIAYISIFLAIVLGLVVGCQKKAPAPQEPTALVSVAPYIYFVRKIAGPHIQVHTLVPETGNPHIYEPKPKEIQNMARAHVWLRLGDPADQKVYRVFQEQNPGMVVVELTQGIELLSTSEKERCHCPEEGKDLHIWLSPRLAKQQAETIAQGLSQAFPEHAGEYEAGLNALLRELEGLDQEISQMLSSKKGEAILVSHPAFAYFCRDYGLTQLSIETEGKDPLPQDITQILEQAKHFKVTAVLLQPQYSNKGAERVAEELKIPTAMINPYAEDYLDNLRHIAQVIARTPT